MTGRNRFIETTRFREFFLRIYDIDVAPIVGGRCALVSPVGSIIQVVGNLRRPSATQVAIEQVALDGLAKTGCSAGRIHFPAGSEIERAPHWVINFSFSAPLLQRLDVPRRRSDRVFHATRLAVDWSH